MFFLFFKILCFIFWFNSLRVLQIKKKNYKRIHYWKIICVLLFALSSHPGVKVFLVLVWLWLHWIPSMLLRSQVVKLLLDYSSPRVIFELLICFVVVEVIFLIIFILIWYQSRLSSLSVDSNVVDEFLVHQVQSCPQVVHYLFDPLLIVVYLCSVLYFIFYFVAIYYLILTIKLIIQNVLHMNDLAKEISQK